MQNAAFEGPLRSVVEAIDTRLDPSSESPIAVAFSGGGDSLALLIATVSYAQRVGRRVVALTVDHQLSPDSPGWTELARINAGKLGADWKGLVWAGQKPSTGLPAAARRARHTLIADAARDAGARVILFGHTADDVIEAIEMRASETPGLGIPQVWGASPVWPAGRGLVLFRPLLNTRRETLRSALRHHGMSWVDDPTNLDSRFARGRARLRLLGSTDIALPNVETSSPDLLAFASGVSFSEWGEAHAEIEALQALERPDRFRALGALLTCVSGAERPPRPKRIARLLDRLAIGTAGTVTLAGALVVLEDQCFRVMREVGDARSERPDATDVFDGRFLSNAVKDLDWLKGKMRKLDPEGRAQLRHIHPRQRPSLPVWQDGDGVVHLARNIGGNGPLVQSLAKARFCLACGVAQREGDLDAL